MLPRFQQILRCWDVWFPVRADVVVLDEDGRGDQRSFASLSRLHQDLEEIEALLARIDPNLRSIPAETRFPYRRNNHTLLEYAGMTCRVMSEYCTAAVEHNLLFRVGGR